MNKIAPFSLRLAPDLRTRLEKIAKINKRSLNAEINLRMQATLEQTNNNADADDCDIGSLSNALQSILREELDNVTLS